MDPTRDPIPYHPNPVSEYEKEQAFYARQDAHNRAVARKTRRLLPRLIAITRRLRFTSSR